MCFMLGSPLQPDKESSSTQEVLVHLDRHLQPHSGEGCIFLDAAWHARPAWFQHEAVILPSNLEGIIIHVACMHTCMYIIDGLRVIPVSGSLDALSMQHSQGPLLVVWCMAMHVDMSLHVQQDDLGCHNYAVDCGTKRHTELVLCHLAESDLAHNTPKELL
jgi:hypothetical protein